ncbi:MAG TPA: alpha-L-rhamnosidase C-terminal domain-containing protein, partial [Fimbriimonas sp.]
ERIGRGSERGDADNWFFETYDVPFPPGKSILVARVWALGVEGDRLTPTAETRNGDPFDVKARAPYAQTSVHPGFLLSPEDPAFVEKLATGKAPWQAKALEGYEFKDPQVAWGTGANVILHGDRMAWGVESGAGEGWGPVREIAPGMDERANDANPYHVLRPATLPPMLDEPRQVGKVRFAADIGESGSTAKIPIREAENQPGLAEAWTAALQSGTPVAVPANSRQRILIDLENYYCAYPELTVSGGRGSLVRVHWQESLYVDDKAGSKGNRDEVEGKFFINIWSHDDGTGDTFLPDGGQGRTFSTLWWQCGRYVEIVVETGDEPLTIDRLAWRETRYPLEPESVFESSDPRMAAAIPMMVRALQMCSHETYMDCPFYEQLMYIGDTRLEVLTTYALTRDDRLPRKALRMFDASRRNHGLTQSRYPSRVLQMIPPFSLWWVAMIHDFALWRGDMAYVEKLQPGARAVLDAFRACTNDDGLIQAPNGWNYMDWVPEWEGGIPPDGNFGVSSVINLQAALVLRQAAKVEEWLGEPDLAHRNRKWADHILDRVREKFWVKSRGVFADDLAHSRFSEHAQSLAILGGGLTDSERSSLKRSLLEDDDLSRQTIYFSHYLFETFRVLGMPEEIQKRLEMWYGLVENGLKTTIEHPEPTRSDCHAWGAHPYFHYLATFAGIRPKLPGFEVVEIRPQLGSLTSLHAKMPTPRGFIEVSVHDGKIDVFVPEGIRGNVIFDGEKRQIG